VDYRALVRSRKIAGPHIYSAGRAIDGQPGSPGSAVVRDEDEARNAVRAQVEDVDFIQLARNLPRELVLASIREAHAADALVMGDLAATSWTFAARAGIDVLSRLVSGNEELLPEGRRAAFRERVAAGADPAAAWLEMVEPGGAEIDAMVGALLSRDIPVTPVLAAVEARLLCVDPEYAEETSALRPDPGFGAGCPAAGWSAEERERAKASWPKAIEIVRLLYTQGVRLLAGSDAPNAWLPAGTGFHRELELLVEAGIPEAKVISIATRNAAIALDVLHEVGTIESGKRADLVLLRSDPLDDIRNLRDIEFVMKDGRFYFVEESEPGTGGQQQSRRLVRFSTTAALNPDGPAAASSRSR